MSSLNALAFRLEPGTQLVDGIKEFVAKSQLQAAFIMTCVGSLQSCTIRLAHADRLNRNPVKSFEEKMEILSLVGTMSPQGVHLHISLGIHVNNLSLSLSLSLLRYD